MPDLVPLRLFPLVSIALLVFNMAACNNEREFNAVSATGGKDGIVLIPVKDVFDGNVHFFTYKIKKGMFKSKNINFFVRTDGKGQLHTYFDACFTCYKFKKGYSVEGTDLVCIECKKRFRLADEVWLDNEGCAPIGLSSEIKDGYLSIKVDNLTKGDAYFF